MSNHKKQFRRRKYRLKKRKQQRKKKLREKKKKKLRSNKKKKKLDNNPTDHLCFDCHKNPRDDYGSHCDECHEKEIRYYGGCEVCESHYD